MIKPKRTVGDDPSLFPAVDTYTLFEGRRDRFPLPSIGSALWPKQRFFDKNLVLCVKTRSFLGTTLAISKTRFLDVPGMLEGEGFFCEAIWDEYKSVLTVCG